MPKHANKPVVIEIPPGETLPVEVLSGAEQTTVLMSHDETPMRKRGVPNVLIKNKDGGYHFPLYPDLVAAGKLEERERFNAAASTVLSSEQYSRLQDAIDTPPEAVSEFQRGTTAMRDVIKADFESFIGQNTRRMSTEFESELLRVVCKAEEPTP